MSLVTLSILAGSVALAAPSISAAPTERSTYLVTFVDGTNPRAEAAQLRAQNYSVSYVYENLFPGVAVELPEAAAQALARSPQVALIEPDGIATISDTQTGATWGLDRVDQRALPLDTTYSYPTSAGTGVQVHVIDTGVLPNHVDFGSRVVSGYSAYSGGTTDCNGHGTHVAGTAAGSQWGLAKKATIVAVRVLDCNGSGSLSGVVAGMDWVAGNHTKPAVANLSLGSGASSTVDAAVDRLVNAGVTVVVAAGNSNADACTASPARAASAITVGSTTSTDARSSFSNFGTCVDIFAPGSSIKSAWHTTTTATNTISGTSMASPHVAGAAALALGQNATLTPAQVTNQLITAATTGIVTLAGTGSPNRLLYSAPGPIVQQELSISTSTLPSANVGTSYSATLSAAGGSGSYSWSGTGVPAGLTLNASGTITGFPTTTGTYTVTVTVNDGSKTVTKDLGLTVAAAKVLPGTFGKTSPLSGATGISRTSAQLTWTASANATSYEVCLNTSTSCTSWTNLGNTTAATASNLRSRTVYYWQVRAVNADGTTVANDGSFWRFTTAR